MAETTADSAEPRKNKISIKDYSLGEEIANSVIHGIGVALSIAALVLLIMYASRVMSGGSPPRSSTGLRSCSNTLHPRCTIASLNRRVKHVFKILDHAGIYLLIAGTYTPFALVTIRDSGGWIIFGFVWGAALIGIATEAFWTYRPRWLSVVVYLAMGWAVVGAIRPLMDNLEPAGVWLLVAGGLAYTVGTIFYVLKKVKYMHAVWHLFVLAGSICHFLAVMLFVIPT